MTITTTHSTSTHGSPNRTVKAIAVGLAITIGSFAFASSASEAMEQAPAPATTEQYARLERACLRIPNLTIRTQNAIERINGKADTRGSLLWLDKAIARATEQDRTDLAEVLTNRRAVRAATVPVLEERLVNLASLAERCSEAASANERQHPPAPTTGCRDDCARVVAPACGGGSDSAGTSTVPAVPASGDTSVAPPPAVPGVEISAAEIAAIEAELDEIDQLLADLDAAFAQD